VTSRVDFLSNFTIFKLTRPIEFGHVAHPHSSKSAYDERQEIHGLVTPPSGGPTPRKKTTL
jgi:hypothetical protein